MRIAFSTNCALVTVMLAFVAPIVATAQSKGESSRPSVTDQVFEPDAAFAAFDESAGKTSEEILKQYESDLYSPLSASRNVAAESGQRTMVETREYPIAIVGTDERDRRLKLISALRDVIREYLKAYKAELGPVESEKQGIDLVQAEYLDTDLLKRRWDREKPGILHVHFGASFHQQLRKRCRQLKLRKIGRFPATLYASAGVFTALLFLYGTLKVLNARAGKRDDYISSGRISMV